MPPRDGDLTRFDPLHPGPKPNTGSAGRGYRHSDFQGQKQGYHLAMLLGFRKQWTVPLMEKDFMKISRHLVIVSVLLLPMIGCRHKQIAPTCPTITESDSISFRSAQAVSNPSFQRVQQSKIVVTLQYTLTSQDTALLVLTLDQFPSVSTCSKDIDGMIRLLPASQVPLQRVLT